MTDRAPRHKGLAKVAIINNYNVTIQNWRID